MTRFKDARVSRTGRIEIVLSDGNAESKKSFSREEAIAVMTGLSQALHERQATFDEVVDDEE